MAEGVLSRLMNAVNLSLQGFREGWLGTPQIKPDVWGEWEYRKGRYETLWAFYRLNQYSETINRWSESFKHKKELYRDIRCVFSYGRRIGEFHATHLWGGALDPNAGDGKSEPSALPIVQVASESLRPMIAKLWRDSEWSSRKDTAPRFGSVMGDVFIEVVDNQKAGKVRLVVHQPTKIKDPIRDHEGNIVEYQVVERVVDPSSVNTIWSGNRDYCEYQRTVSVDPSGRVTYRTYKDGRPYNWGDGPEGSDGEWTRDYGFAPMVQVEHIDIGLLFGDSEVAGACAQISESDHLGSMLHDQIAKILNGPWMFSGIDKINTATISTRTDVPAFTAPRDAKAQQLVGDMPIGELSAHIKELREDIERSYPELMIDRARSSGDMSGKSMREAKKPAETKIKSRRASYDEALVRAHRMALSIGAFQGYESYSMLGDNAYDSGDLDHQIGDRNVFQMDIFDRLEMKTGVAVGVKAMLDAGFDPQDAFAEFGFSQDVIARASAAIEKRMTIESGGMSPQQTPNRPTLDRQPQV